MDQISALWLVVGRTNRSDLAPVGGRTEKIIKATAVSGEHIRSIGTTINNQSGRLLTFNLNTELDATTIIQFTAVSHLNCVIKVNGGRPSISSW